MTCQIQLTAKQYSSPSPPVERRSACEQPPSAPREGCEEFHECAASIVVEALPVVVAEHDRALRAARVVLAGHVLVGRKGFAVRRRAGDDVMPVRLVAAAVDDLALLRQIVLLAELVVGAVQIVDAGGDDHALGIHPRPLADAVARVHRAGALRRQIRMPGLGPRADRRCEILAMLVGAGKPAEIGALARPGAGDEETHIGLLRLRRRCAEQRQACRQRHAIRIAVIEVLPTLAEARRPALSRTKPLNVSLFRRFTRA